MIQDYKHIDLKLVLKLCYNDESLVFDYLQAILSELEKISKELKGKIVSKRESSELFRTIHMMKATMQLLGSKEGIMICQQLLDEINASFNKKRINKYLHKLEEIMPLLSDDVKNYFKKLNPNQKLKS